MGAQQAGFVDVACISGAQIDKYGNLNSTVIGDYHAPKVRLAGSGGANHLASSAGRTIIMLRQDGRNFVNKGGLSHLAGPPDWTRARQKAAGRKRPAAVITTMGVYRFDAETLRNVSGKDSSRHRPERH